MAKVIVKVYATNREKFPHGEVEVEGNSIVEVLRKLVLQFPEIRDEILDGNLNLKDNYVYLLNGINVHFLKSGATLVKDGDKISVFPPVAGG